MTREDVIRCVEEFGGTANTNVPKSKVIGWVKVLPATSSRKPTVYKVGDVFMHVMFKHPYILLKKTKLGWICGLITSESGCPEILEACQSRFFPEDVSYFTRALFTTVEIQGTFLNNYDNNRHLKEVHKKLKEILIK